MEIRIPLLRIIMFLVNIVILLDLKHAWLVFHLFLMGFEIIGMGDFTIL